MKYIKVVIFILLINITILAQYDDRIRIEPTKIVCKANYFYFDTTTSTIKVCRNASTQVSIGGGGGTFTLNGLTTNPQLFAVGSSGTDFTILSSGSTHTFNLPTASAVNRGLLSTTDWVTFNNKVTSVFGRTGVITAQSNDYNFNQLAGTVSDSQIPNNITIDLSTQATTALTGDSATGFFSAGLIEPARLMGTVTNERCLRINNLGEIVVAASDCGSSSGITGLGTVNSIPFFTTVNSLTDSFFNQAGDSTNPRFNFGGATNLFPSLRRNGNKLQVRLADNSAYAELETADEVYDSTLWDANNEVPTKNALRDKFESLVIGGSVTDAQVPDNITINGTNNVTWASVNKTGSSLADLVTRGFAQLTGSAIDSQIPDNITISGTNNVTWSSVNKTGSSLSDLASRAFSELTGSITDAQVPNSITIDVSSQALTGDSATNFFSTGTIEPSRLITGSVTNSRCLRVNSSSQIEVHSSDCGSGSGSGTVNSGTANQIAYYATSSTTLSGNSRLTENGTKLTYSGTDGFELSDVAAGAIVLSTDVGIKRTNASELTVTDGSSGFGNLKSKLLILDLTITSAGTTGNQTINKSAGTVNIAAGNSSVTITNSLVTANSIINVLARTNDSTCSVKNYVPASGSFVINMTANCTAETSVGFIVIN
jgi:hypothetical protein